MKIEKSGFLSIEQLQDQYLNQTQKVGKNDIGAAASFDSVLRQKLLGTEGNVQSLKFSKHAANRLVDRNITLSDNQIARLSDGARKAGEKGIQDSLVIVDELAFIVNIPNKTVITAMDQTETNENVFTNPNIYQINTPQSYLYSEVYEHYLRKFPNAHVVFLDAGTGHTDKDPFIKGLKEELKNNQITFKELKGEAINPEGMKLVVDSLRENVIIPTSGKSVVLTKVLPQLVITAREHPNYNMKLFGYPEWQTYTDDWLASFFELDTYFYSSFYTNNLFPEPIQFTNAYRKWYSKDMANTFPKYGMLGFDTAFFFLQGLHKYGSNFEESMNQMQVTPIQTGFKFERVNNWGGFINRKVFFVNFTKNYELIKLDFE